MANVDAGYLEQSFASHHDQHVPDWLHAKHSTGTSIMAVEFEGGVVMGADSRTTTGAYIANRVSDKLTPITEKIMCCRAGAAADTQAVADMVSYHLSFHEIELNEIPRVETAANIFRELCYNYRDSMTCGIIVGGWDHVKGGQVYAIPIGGMLVRQKVAIGGSGSTYVYGYLDSNYRDNMTKDETVKFVVNTLSLAMARDGSSGGCVRIAVISKDGIEKTVHLGNTLPEFYQG